MTTLTNTPEASATDQETGAYPESTLSLRLDVDGIGLSWTLRGTDESMARRLPRVLSYLKRLQAKLPTPETPRPVAVPSAPLEEREDWCAIHGKAMVTHTNDRGTWKAHRSLEGWCKGQRPRAGERRA